MIKTDIDEADSETVDAVDGTALTATDETAEATDAPPGADESEGSPETEARQPRAWVRKFMFVAIVILALLMTLGVAYLKYEVGSAQADKRSAVESVQAAKDGTVAILSYTPETADATLGAAADRLTGMFRESYTSLTHQVVIPGAKQKNISAAATVVAAAPVSTTENHAVVLVFVNQAITMGSDAPSSTASVVEVTLDRSADRWLISGFDPK